MKRPAADMRPIQLVTSIGHISAKYQRILFENEMTKVVMRKSERTAYLSIRKLRRWSTFEI